MNSFEKLAEIVIADPLTWKGRAFLTFDIDSAHGEVIEDAGNMVEFAGVAATWLVIHDTSVLMRLRSNPMFEFGIHPNFNFLLERKASKADNIGAVIDRLIEIVPGIRSVRSHSIAQSGPILAAFADSG